MKKTFLFLFVMWFNLLHSQCDKDCYINPLNFELISNQKVLKKIDQGRFVEAFDQLNKPTLSKKQLFDTTHIGVGCFYYYLAIAELAVATKENKHFRDVLIARKLFSINFFQEKGFIAANHALIIIDQYNSGYCTNKKKQILGLHGNQGQLYKNKLLKIIDKLKQQKAPGEKGQPLKLPNLVISAISCASKSITVGQKVNFTVVIENTSDIETKLPVSLEVYQQNSFAKLTEDIGILKANERKTISLSLSFFKPDVQSIQFYIDPNNILEESAEDDNTAKESIFVIPKPGLPHDGNNTLVISTDQNNKNFRPTDTSIKLLKNTDECNCVNLQHHFEISSFETEASNEIDAIILGEILRPLFNDANHSPKALKVTITGYADGSPFVGSLNINLSIGTDQKEIYYSLNDRQEKVAVLNDSINDNELLAFLRAYIFKAKLLKVLPLKQEQMSLETYVHSSKAKQYRQGNLKICSDQFTLEDLIKIQETIEERLKKELPIKQKSPTNDRSIAKEFIISSDSLLQEELKSIPQEEFKQNMKETITTNVPFTKLQEEAFHLNDTFKIKNLLFEVGTFQINPSSYPSLDEIAEFVKRSSSLVIEVGGHTNSLCDTNPCLELSRERAKAVYHYLIMKGCPENRLSYKGYGKETLLHPNPTKAKNIRELNQRVEIKILSIR